MFKETDESGAGAPQEACAADDPAHGQPDAARRFGRNRLLFRWLSEDCERDALYGYLRANGFPILTFKSLLRSKGGAAWPDQDVHLVSARCDIERALKGFSVQPYAELESGGRFMLGLDDVAAHDKQRAFAKEALDFSKDEVKKCAEVALERASVQPLKRHDFDLVALAEQSALHFVSLLFGLPIDAHTRMQLVVGGAYRKLTFQIIGRHFVPNAGLPPARSSDTQRIKTRLEELIREARSARNPAALANPGVPEETVIARLYKHYGDDRDDEVPFLVLGLIAGTIGNVRAAVANAIRHFFNTFDGTGRRLLETAREAAWDKDETALHPLIDEALLRDPPAAFLARTARKLPRALQSAGSELDRIPAGDHVLLAMGADPDPALLFGGMDGSFMHRCVGVHFAKPLVYHVVRQVLRLPGLAQEIDPDTGKPYGLRKLWGASCESYRMQYRRDRCLNQQPLFVVLPIKEPVAENARKLEALTRAGAHIVEEALRESKHVHFAWFCLVENRTHLAMMTAYDGDFDAYVEHFAVKVSLFDTQFEFLDVEQPTPIAQYPKEFVDTIRKYNRAPLGDYFFSAYPLVSVAEIRAAAGLP